MIYGENGTRLTDCCAAYSKYFDGVLCCKKCYNEVPAGQGDGSEVRDGKVEGREAVVFLVAERP